MEHVKLTVPPESNFQHNSDANVSECSEKFNTT